MIEMTDGIQVLVADSCCEPTVPLIRSSFEAFLSLSYLLKADYKNRSRSWLYFDYRRTTRKLQRLDPETASGKELALALGRDLPNVGFPKLSAQQREYIRKRSDHQLFEDIDEEYKRTKHDRKIRRPDWYTLFNGPDNIQSLAKALSLEHFYIVLYREWSETAHAVDSSRYIEVLSDGTVVGHQLRLADNLKDYGFYSGFFFGLPRIP